MLQMDEIRRQEMEPNLRGEVKLKVCLIGDGGVGKTSLIRRFVFSEFDERYLYTLGTNVSKKEVTLVWKGQEVKATLMVWDIMGQKSLKHLFTESYFKDADGGIAVCDCTRTDTFDDLTEWIENMFSGSGEVPITILANKIDLRDQTRIEDRALAEFAAAYDAPYLFTSAKTGENVERAFAKTAELIAGRAASLDPKRDTEADDSAATA